MFVNEQIKLQINILIKQNNSNFKILLDRNNYTQNKSNQSKDNGKTIEIVIIQTIVLVAD